MLGARPITSTAGPVQVQYKIPCFIVFVRYNSLQLLQWIYPQLRFNYDSSSQFYNLQRLLSNHNYNYYYKCTTTTIQLETAFCKSDPNKDLDAQTSHNRSPNQRTHWTRRNKKTSKLQRNWPKVSCTIRWMKTGKKHFAQEKTSLDLTLMYNNLLYSNCDLHSPWMSYALCKAKTTNAQH